MLLLRDDILASESENQAVGKILFVADEPSVVDAIQRAFRGKLDIQVAYSADRRIARDHGSWQYNGDVAEVRAQ